jgi:hypothetical protein
MATKITCDLCDREIDEGYVKVECRDGEHPHNGSIMYKTADCCGKCLMKITTLHTNEEYDDLRKKMKKGSR